MTRAKPVFLLAVVLTVLTGCDLMSSGVTAPEDGAPDLFQQEKSRSDMPPRLFISLRMPTVACEDADYYDHSATERPDGVDGGRVQPVKRILSNPGATYAREEDKHFVMDEDVNNSVKFSNTNNNGLLDNGGEYPSWFPEETFEDEVPDGHTLFNKFEVQIYMGFLDEEDEDYVSEYRQDLPENVSVTMNSSSGGSRVNVSRGTRVYFGGSSESGGGEAGTVTFDPDYLGSPEDFPFKPAQEPAYISYSQDDTGTSLGPQMGTVVLKFKMPEGSDFLPGLRKLALSSESDLESVDGEPRTFRMESSNPYGVDQTLGETLGGIIDTKIEDLAKFGLAATVFLALGGAAPALVASAAGTALAGTGTVALGPAGVEITLAVADFLIDPVKSGGVASLASGVIGAGTNIAVVLTDEEDPESCDINQHGVIPGPEAPEEVGNALNDAFPSLTGPFVMVGDVSRELGYTDVDVPGLSRSDASWGRATTDGREEVALSGNLSDGGSFSPSTQIYSVEEIEEGGRGEALIPLDTDIVNVGFSSVAWEDTDQSDGPQDLVVSGFKEGDGFEPVTRLYRNSGGTFEAANAGLVDVGQGDVEWASHDGDSYLLVTGFRERRIDPADPVTRLYRDAGSGFEKVSDAELVDVGQSDVEWADFVGGPKPDLAISGRDETGKPVTKLYENAGGGFQPVGANVPGVMYGSLAWGDYDGDGDPDLTISGRTNRGNPTLRIYENEGYENEGGGSFSLARDQDLGLEKSDAEWRDFNKDGLQDLVVTGESTSATTETAMVVIRNAGGDKLGEPRQYTGVRHGSVSWGDYDGDDDLDLIQVGEREDRTSFGRLLENRQ